MARDEEMVEVDGNIYCNGRDSSVVLIGPFYPDDRYKVSVEGFLVPHIYLMKGTTQIGDFVAKPDPDGFDVYLDDRLVYQVKRANCGVWFALLANAMAVAAGRSCFGPNARPIDHFNVRIGPSPVTPESTMAALEESDARMRQSQKEPR